MRPKQLGIAIVVLSVAVIGLMIFFKVQFDVQQQQACASACGETGADSCTIKSCPYHNEGNLGWVPIIASILIAGLGGIGIYLSFSKEEKIIEQKEYDLTKLNSEEKEIFLFIKENKDLGVYQSNIVEKFNIPKSKVSRILDKMESLEIVERKRRGMTNIILLK